MTPVKRSFDPQRVLTHRLRTSEFRYLGYYRNLRPTLTQRTPLSPTLSPSFLGRAKKGKKTKHLLVIAYSPVLCWTPFLAQALISCPGLTGRGISSLQGAACQSSSSADT